MPNQRDGDSRAPGGSRLDSGIGNMLCHLGRHSIGRILSSLLLDSRVGLPDRSRPLRPIERMHGLASLPYCGATGR